MFCPKCGAKLPDDVNFCIHCGNRIGGKISSPEVPAPVPEAAPAVPQVVSEFAASAAEQIEAVPQSPVPDYPQPAEPDFPAPPEPSLNAPEFTEAASAYEPDLPPIPEEPPMPRQPIEQMNGASAFNPAGGFGDASVYAPPQNRDPNYDRRPSYNQQPAGDPGYDRQPNYDRQPAGDPGYDRQPNYDRQPAGDPGYDRYQNYDRQPARDPGYDRYQNYNRQPGNPPQRPMDAAPGRPERNPSANKSPLVKKRLSAGSAVLAFFASILLFGAAALAFLTKTINMKFEPTGGAFAGPFNEFKLTALPKIDTWMKILPYAVPGCLALAGLLLLISLLGLIPKKGARVLSKLTCILGLLFALLGVGGFVAVWLLLVRATGGTGWTRYLPTLEDPNWPGGWLQCFTSYNATPTTTTMPATPFGWAVLGAGGLGTLFALIAACVPMKKIKVRD